MSGTFISGHGVGRSLIEIRPLGHEDIPGVLGVQRSAYPDPLIESSSSFSRKLEVWPAGARGAFDGREMVGYLFCHPWTVGEIAPLDDRELVLPEPPSCLYVHDLAVRADRKGRGIGGLLAAEVPRLAGLHSLDACALVAVQGAHTFWERQGFIATREIKYGSGARAFYMVRSGSSPPKNSAAEKNAHRAEERSSTVGADDGTSPFL